MQEKLGAHLVSNVVNAEGHLCFLELSVWLILVLHQETGEGVHTCKAFVRGWCSHPSWWVPHTALVGHDSSMIMAAARAWDKDGTKCRYWASSKQLMTAGTAIIPKGSLLKDQTQSKVCCIKPKKWRMEVGVGKFLPFS